MKVEETNLDPAKEINFFDNGYEFLSNMYPCKVEYEGLTYQTSEAAFQAAKFDKKEYKMMFTDIKPDNIKKNEWKRYARPAKKLGSKNGKISKNDPEAFDKEEWDNGRAYKVMKEVVLAKFTQNPDLKEMLVATGDACLIEGTTWKDTTWGVDLSTMRGKNQLGKILMEVRQELNTKMEKTQ